MITSEHVGESQALCGYLETEKSIGPIILSLSRNAYHISVLMFLETSALLDTKTVHVPHIRVLSQQTHLMGLRTKIFSTQKCCLYEPLR